MKFATGGYLPYEGGDNAPSQSLTSPFSHRTLQGSYPYSYESYSGSASSGSSPLYFLVESRESRRHPVSYLGRTQSNIGGKFVHTKLQVDRLGRMLSPYSEGSTWRKASGMFVASSGFMSDLTPSPTGKTYQQCSDAVTTNAQPATSTELNARGTTAIARVAPTNPLVDLSSSLAELGREGLPTLPGKAGNAGGEYLNIMFGYVPLVSDAKKLAQTARNRDALLSQYERDSGRWIRRKYKFPPVVETSTTSQSGVVCAMVGTPPSGLVQAGQRITTKTTEREFWFSGAFTYHLPRSGWRRTVAELDYLYGVRPGIDTAWELTGWSWLADYFSNAGDVAKNLTAFKQDGLVMPYGYVMCKTVMTVEETWIGPVRFKDWKETTVSSVKTYTIHQRKLANPFGFGLEFDGLSGRQLSILVALGISRA